MLGLHRSMLASAIVVFGMTTHVVAATYYVDALNGNDSADGKIQPWKTLATVTARTFSPGDQILLKRGGTWYESLRIQSSGTAAAPITFGAYGNGSSPVVDEQGVRWPAVWIPSQSHVVLRDITFQNSSDYSIYINGSSFVTVQDCIIRNSQSHAIAANDVSAGLVIDHNTYTMDPGFKMAGSFLMASSQVDGITVSNNSATFNGLGNNPGIIVEDVDNAQIYGNTIIGSTQAIGVKSYYRELTAPQIHDNAIYNTDDRHGDGESIEITGYAGRQLYVESAAVYRNYVAGGPYTNAGIAGVWSKNAAVYDNIVVGPTIEALHWSSNCPGTLLYNNTVFNTEYGAAIQSGSSATIVNNIFYSISGSGISLDSAAAATEDYNIFYNSGPNNGVAAGAHSITGNPEFVSANPAAAADFRLQAGSSAAGSGSKLAAPFNWALNPAASCFPCAVIDQNSIGKWSRGAFAYLPPSDSSGRVTVSVSPAALTFAQSERGHRECIAECRAD